ncbi:MAG TPA: EAL domain-containing protein [Burkholderiaceae bacterium]|nr:EAL domain-containing protein [Burkholderiaceae bacterium]
MRRGVRSLRTRATGFVLALLLGVQLAGFGMIRASIERNARADVARQLEVGARVFERLMRHETETLAQGARILASDYGFREAIGSDDLETITSALANHGGRIGATVAMYWNAGFALKATTVATLAPEARDHVAALVRGAARSAPVDGAVLIDGHLHRFVVVPVLAPLPIGWVVMGFATDARLAADLRELSALEVSFLADGAHGSVTPIATTLPGSRAAALSTSVAGPLASPGRPTIVPIDDTEWGTLAVPLPVQPGRSVHALLQRSVDEATAPYARLQTTLLALTAVGVLVSALLGVAAARRVFRPLEQLAEAAQRLGRGDASTPLPAVTDDEVGRLSGSFAEMRAQLAEREARIARLAYHDGLTGLPNRESFRLRLEAALADARGRSVAVLMLDLDRFKHVNDVLGHAFGDRVLAGVAERLAAVARDAGAPLARLGGDEFALLVDGAGAARAFELAAAIGEAMGTPIVIDGQSIDLGGALGIAAHPEHGADAATLLARAEIAMYAAKARRAGPLAYDPALDDSSAESLSLAGELREAIARDQLVLAWQPKVALRDGRIAGAEALVRWRHPVRGAVPPDRFLPFAEQSGLIREITRWVLARAVRQAAAWRDAGLSVPVAVNLSTRDLLDAALPQRVAAALAEHRLPPSMLTLEITESAIMEEPDRALQVLHSLRALGVALSIDDFGTGHASLAYLKRLPVHELKIDRSFTRTLTTDAADATIVRSTIDLGHDLGLKLVAEGIEDEATAAALRAAGCDTGQGWRWARALPADEFAAWARAWSAALAAEAATVD